MASDEAGFLGNILGSPVTITSGYRSPQHNALVGGVPNSAHLTGQAYDFVPQGMSMTDAQNKIVQSGIPFDQLINERDHVHVSFDPKNRRQVIGQKVAGISDADLMKALTSDAPSAAPSAPQGQASGISDDQLLAALTGGKPKAAPTTNYYPPGDSRNGPAAVTVGGGGQPGVPQTQQGTLADVVRSIPGAITKGVTGVLGLPGDINSLLDKGANALTGQNISTTQLPTSEGLNTAVSKPFGGYYEPQTKAGKYTDTIGQFLPAAAAPGNALLRAARVLVPGASSETAGELAEGTPLEGVARFVGAMAGAGSIGAVKDLATAGPKALIPSTSDIKSAASTAYKRAEQAGVVVKESAVKSLGSQISQDVTDAGIDPTLHPKATAALKRVVDSTGDLTLKKLDILRRVANGAAGSFDPDESRVAHIILDHIDDFVKNLGPGDVLAGNTQVASDSIKEARALWAKQAKSGTIDSLLERAKNRAETIGGSGLENAIRVEFRGLAQNAKRLARFSPDEQSAIKAVARGGPLTNFARTIGKLAPTNLISILGELAAFSADTKAVALPIAGAAGRLVATAGTKQAAKRASELVRSGGIKAPTKGISPETLTGLLARKNRNSDESNNALIPSYAGQ